ncbi:Receptor-like serine/threonine-protein kinase SD1-8 [Vitis vinifera]|uniref:Receptor-like serine/threonine-protein kinase n=1 Tax=Vitis vinifera TaxID=29760 RepID=A0A438GDQ3_VITVI|nr:Receptor-like serine/threonine-protein kinase SD1-8 [Vitis vinifera]
MRKHLQGQFMSYLGHCKFSISVDAAPDTIFSGQMLRQSDTIISAENFRANGGMGCQQRLHNNWFSPSLTINDDGNLVILDGRVTYMVANISLGQNVSATLLDSGNLILRNGNSNILWQSFDYPSDHFLPGMKIGYNRKTGEVWSFTSWKNAEDPGLGPVSLKMDPETHQFVIMWNSQMVWSSGVWNGHAFSSVPEMRLNYIFNYSYFEDMSEAYFTYSFCNNQTTPICQCLYGFRPNSTGDWMMNQFRDGCVRKTSLQCDDLTSVNSEKDKFLKMANVKFPQSPQILETQSIETCKMTCLNKCSCNAYAHNGSCLMWDRILLNLQQLSKKDPDGRTLYLKLAASELQNSREGKMPRWVIGMVVVAVLVLLLASYICYRRMKRVQDREEMTTSQDILLYEFGMGSKATENELNEGNRVGKDKNKDAWLPLFSFASVSAATEHFSTENKLGQGGFGPVYKGELFNGQEIAVKRLSRSSGQGLEELKNETVLLAELQHRNLVRLLGCCIEQGEKILIYEYMPNKSLDSFLFDPNKRGQLDWAKRVSIIEGIAQGLLYLHEYSRLRIIHRDLKASNILLDNDMNPKISDFGMARMFGGNESYANTNRIVGTYGYMSPEYALEGLFSTKSDVFSFGVLMLEILSGKKNTGFYNSDTLNLIGYAWELWKSDMAINLMDPMLEGQSSQYMLLRYINVGLLCVEEIAADRPTLSEVVSMLTNELAVLPSPKHPAFSTVRSMENPRSSMSRPEIYSANGLSISVMEAR